MKRKKKREKKDEKEEKKNEKEKQNNVEKKDEIKNNNTSNNQNINNNINNNNTQNNTQRANQNNDFNNIFGNVMNQLMTPQNLNSIAGAMGSMLNNQGSNQSEGGGNSQGLGGLFGNLFSNLMGSLGEDSDEEDDNNNIPLNQQPNIQQNKDVIPPKENSTTNNNDNDKNVTNSKNVDISLIKKLVESPQLRRETKINDESKIGEKMEPNIEFKPFSNEILANLTVQEIFNMYNLNFTGLSRLRKDIKEKYFKDKNESDKTIKKVIELLCERMILIENDVDKLIPDKEFNIEEFFNKHLKEIFNMLIDDEEINKFDSKWESKFKKLVINMFISLKNEIKGVYETGEDGAKAFIEYNILTLIEELFGQKYLSLIQKYDKDIINKFVENLFTIIKAEEIKQNCTEGKKDNENIEKPILLSVDEIFKIANKDKERLEKEEKEKSEDDNQKKYSDFYYLTSLFKN